MKPNIPKFKIKGYSNVNLIRAPTDHGDLIAWNLVFNNFKLATVVKRKNYSIPIYFGWRQVHKIYWVGLTNDELFIGKTRTGVLNQLLEHYKFIITQPVQPRLNY